MAQLAQRRGLASPACAETEAQRLQALERRLESSAQLIEKLSVRLAELERNTGPQASAAPAAETTQAIAALQQSVAQLAEGTGAKGRETGLPVHGFADVGAGWSSKNDPSRLRGFNAGTLDLYLTPQFGDRVKSLVELVFEYDSAGGLAVDLERLQLGYTVSDALTVWLGRFHTPFGVWNTWYHHGAGTTTAPICRPRSSARACLISKTAAASCRTTRSAHGPPARRRSAPARSPTTPI